MARSCARTRDGALPAADSAKAGAIFRRVPARSRRSRFSPWSSPCWASSWGSSPYQVFWSAWSAPRSRVVVRYEPVRRAIDRYASLTARRGRLADERSRRARRWVATTATANIAERPDRSKGVVTPPLGPWICAPLGPGICARDKGQSSNRHRVDIVVEQSDTISS